MTVFLILFGLAGWLVAFSILFMLGSVSNLYVQTKYQLDELNAFIQWNKDGNQ